MTQSIINSDGSRTGYIYGLFASDRPMFLWECRYIGKTVKTLRDRLYGHETDARRDLPGYRNKWVRSVWARGAEVIIKEFEVYTEPNNDAINKRLNEREIAWIASGRRQGWRLTNATDGGDGLAGLTHSPETRAKISASHMGKEKSPEHRANLSKALAGQIRGPYTEEHGAAISAAKMGHEVSEETRAKISATFAEKREDKTHCANGHEYTEESMYIRPNGGIDCRICSRDKARERRGFGQPRKPHSDTARANMSAAQRGLPKSQAHKDALSESRRTTVGDTCLHGHPFDEENTAWRESPVNGRMVRHCRECERQRARNGYHRRKAEKETTQPDDG